MRTTFHKSQTKKNNIKKKLAQELRTTKIQFLGALSKIKEFLLNTHIFVQSKAAPETYRSYEGAKQEHNEDRFHNDPFPDLGTSVNISCQSVYVSIQGKSSNRGIEGTMGKTTHICGNKITKLSTFSKLLTIFGNAT